jgi:hypothetical protein
MEGVDFSSIVDELYSLPPGEFTKARDAAAADARRRRDSGLAEQIKQLRRPSAAAWALNTFVREMPGEVDGLLDLGARLRDAQASLSAEQLRSLGRQRHRVVASTVAQVAAHAARRGQPLSGAAIKEVEGSLEAALADPEAASALRSGRLVRSMSYAGFGSVDTTGAAVNAAKPSQAPGVASPTSGLKPDSAGEHDGAGSLPEPPSERLQLADQAAADALRRAERAARALDDAQHTLGRHKEQTELAQAEVGRLEAQLAVARTHLEEATREESGAQKARDTAAQAALDSRHAAESAASEVAALRQGVGE